MHAVALKPESAFVLHALLMTARLCFVGCSGNCSCGRSYRHWLLVWASPPAGQRDHLVKQMAMASDDWPQRCCLSSIGARQTRRFNVVVLGKCVVCCVTVPCHVEGVLVCCHAMYDGLTGHLYSSFELRSVMLTLEPRIDAPKHGIVLPTTRFADVEQVLLRTGQ